MKIELRGRWYFLLGLTLLASLSTQSVLAEQSRISDADNTIARLEEILQHQRARLENLQEQVAAVEEGSESARIAAMKEQIREVLGETEFRASLAPSAIQVGYERGLFIRSSNELFSIRVNTRIQFRWTHYGTGSRNRYTSPKLHRNDRTGFDLPRIYTAFSGHAYSKDLTYGFILDGSEYRGYNFGVLHAWVNYRFIDEFQIRAGIMRVSGTRANYNTATMQMVETPVVEEALTLHRGLGVRFWGRLRQGKPVHGQYRLDIINTLANPGTRTITTDRDLYTLGHDNNPAIVFRTVWSLLDGTCEQPSDEIPYNFASCDLACHTSPALNIGFHYAFQEDDHDGSLRIPVANRGPTTPGGFALITSEGMQIHQFGLDGGFKYRGFSAMAEYVLRLLDVRRGGSASPAPIFQATGEGSTTSQHAAYLQCGYFLPIPGFERKIELAGRVGWLHVSTGGSETMWEYGGGLNYYIEGHRVKLQTDVTKITEAPFAFSANSLANVNDEALIWRVQLQFAF